MESNEFIFCYDVSEMFDCQETKLTFSKKCFVNQKSNFWNLPHRILVVYLWCGMSSIKKWESSNSSEIWWLGMSWCRFTTWMTSCILIPHSSRCYFTTHTVISAAQSFFAGHIRQMGSFKSWLVLLSSLVLLRIFMITLPH